MLHQHEQEHHREHERWQAARRQALGLMFELQNYARDLMAISAQDPAATDGLTGRGPRPLDERADRPVLEAEVVPQPTGADGSSPRPGVRSPSPS